jgi:hypothetical protein
MSSHIKKQRGRPLATNSTENIVEVRDLTCDLYARNSSLNLSGEKTTRTIGAKKIPV